MKIKNIETALADFEDYADKHGKASEDGDSRTGSKCYRKIEEIFEFLKKENTRDKFQKFLSHPSSGIRLWAATFLLPINEKEAKKVLNEITQIGGIVSFSAKMILQEWNKGNLNYLI